MADSIRKQILDAAETALNGISGIGTVSQNLRAYSELKPKDFPAVYPIDGDAEYEHAAFEMPSGRDMVCNLELVIFGYVYDRNNVLSLKRTNLIRSIELALVTDTDLAALITEIEPTRVLTDPGTWDNYSVIRYEFMVQYHYNHNTP